MDGAAAEGTDIVEGIKEMVFGSDEAVAGRAGAVGGAALGQVITGMSLKIAAASQECELKFSHSCLDFRDHADMSMSFRSQATSENAVGVCSNG